MQWLMSSHVRRYHGRYRRSRHVWQGRSKSFPLDHRRPTRAERAARVIETACPLWTVVRYVKRDPLRAKLVARAEECAWLSLRYSAQLAGPPGWVETSWLTRPAGWLAMVDGAESADDLPGFACASPWQSGRASEHRPRPAAGAREVGSPDRRRPGPGIPPPPPRKANAKKGARTVACPLSYLWAWNPPSAPAEGEGQERSQNSSLSPILSLTMPGEHLLVDRTCTRRLRVAVIVFKPSYRSSLARPSAYGRPTALTGASTTALLYVCFWVCGRRGAPEPRLANRAGVALGPGKSAATQHTG